MDLYLDGLVPVRLTLFRLPFTGWPLDLEIRIRSWGHSSWQRKGVKMGINVLECTNYKFLGIFDLLNYHFNPISNHNIDFQSPVDFQILKTCQATKISDKNRSPRRTLLRYGNTRDNSIWIDTCPV